MGNQGKRLCFSPRLWQGMHGIRLGALPNDLKRNSDVAKNERRGDDDNDNDERRCSVDEEYLLRRPVLTAIQYAYNVSHV